MTTAVIRGDRITCARDGAALFRVERIQDYAVCRRRAIFLCGHSVTEPLNGLPTPVNPRITGVCVTCGKPFPRRRGRGQKCLACMKPEGRVIAEALAHYSGMRS